MVVNIVSSQTPPPLIARPRGAYYPHGINGQAIPLPDLFEAVMQNDKGRVKDLLDHGANPNEPAPNGYAPIIQSTFSGVDPEICKMLVEHGANVNVVTPPNQKGYWNKWTPLFYAVNQKRSELVAILLAHGARTDLRDGQGKSPMDLAKQVKSDEIVQQLRAVAPR
jgi:ankyrin repeat protein